MAGLRAPRTPQEKQPRQRSRWPKRAFKLPLLTAGGEAGGVPEPQTAAGGLAEGPGGIRHQAGGEGPTQTHPTPGCLHG